MCPPPHLRWSQGTYKCTQRKQNDAKQETKNLCFLVSNSKHKLQFGICNIFLFVLETLVFFHFVPKCRAKIMTPHKVHSHNRTCSCASCTRTLTRAMSITHTDTHSQPCNFKLATVVTVFGRVVHFGWKVKLFEKKIQYVLWKWWDITQYTWLHLQQIKVPFIKYSLNF